MVSVHLLQVSRFTPVTILCEASEGEVFSLHPWLLCIVNGGLFCFFVFMWRAWSPYIFPEWNGNFSLVLWKVSLGERVEKKGTSVF